MTMTYAQLQQAVQDFLETSETSFVSNIPLFVRMAEQRIYRSVMIPELRKNATAPLTIGNPYLQRPSDFLSAFSLAVVANGSYTYLIDKDVNFIREAYPNPSEQGVPRYYAQFDGDQSGASEGNFILAPTPNAAYTVELHYYYDPPSIVDTNTSWLGNNAETVLFYGTIIEAYTYLKGDQDMMAVYNGRYSEAMMQLFGIDIRAKRDDYRGGTISAAQAVR